MKILFLSHDIPCPTASDTLPLYYLIRYLSVLFGHDITLISFASERSRAEDFEHLKNVCSIEDPIGIQWSARNKLLLKAIRNSILHLPKNLKHGLLVNELDYYYDRRMDQKIREAINKNNFDLIFSTRQMANYVADVDAAKIVQPFDAMYEWHRQLFENSTGLRKIAYGIRYALNRSYEKRIYEKFDACLVVTEIDKELLESLNPRIRCSVVPNGVDIDYFSPIDINEEPSSIIFLSSMNMRPAIVHVIQFYNEIFPFIREAIPDVKLYLVGRDPAKEIVDLSADPAVRVTGFVNDVRPYVAQSTVFIAPEFLGTGIKNKVLQAMSMGKAVVTTTAGARGIAARDGVHLVVADTFKEFAKKTVSLLKDRRMRATLGTNARKLMEEQYSWEAITKLLNESLVNICSERE